MTRTEAFDRMEYLRNAIAYSRHTESMMTIGEGIMCNQEVAALFSVCDGVDSEPRYIVTDEIENKVVEINKVIRIKLWQKPVIEIL